MTLMLFLEPTDPEPHPVSASAADTTKAVAVNIFERVCLVFMKFTFSSLHWEYLVKYESLTKRVVAATQSDSIIFYYLFAD